MMKAQSMNPSDNDVEKAHLIKKCNDFMIMTNIDVRTMARKILMIMKAREAVQSNA